jgi:hypothetical protein
MKDTGLADESIDIAVFFNSLMGLNWADYIAEAKRCLYRNGIIMIANSSYAINEGGGRLATLRDELKEQGFEIYRDMQAGEFTFIEARKI